MFGRRELLTIAMTLLVAIGNEGCQGQSDEYTNDYVNEDFIPTYKSKIEKTLKGLTSIVSGNSSSSNSFENGGGGIGTFLGSFLPAPVKEVVAPVETITAGGFGAVLNHFKKHVRFISPGTRWCGDGNKASSEDDLGFFENTDACCRGHDSCNTIINAGETRGLLINDGIFTRSACTCDEEFYKCLKKVNSLVSMKIGMTYFNILRPQCFSDEYPIKSCEEYDSILSFNFLNRKCVRYDFDYSQEKMLQWLDSPDF